MLILSRRIGEEMIVGDNIKVRILGIKGNQIRLGIDAPKEVIVDRAEIRQRKILGLPHKNKTVE